MKNLKILFEDNFISSLSNQENRDIKRLLNKIIKKYNGKILEFGKKESNKEIIEIESEDPDFLKAEIIKKWKKIPEGARMKISSVQENTIEAGIVQDIVDKLKQYIPGTNIKKTMDLFKKLINHLSKDVSDRTLISVISSNPKLENSITNLRSLSNTYLEDMEEFITEFYETISKSYKSPKQNIKKEYQDIFNEYFNKSGFKELLMILSQLGNILRELIKDIEKTKEDKKESKDDLSKALYGFGRSLNSLLKRYAKASTNRQMKLAKLLYIISSTEPVFTLEDFENNKERFEKEINAPYVRTEISILGGKHRPYFLITISLDPKEEWINNILHNSRAAFLSLDHMGKLELNNWTSGQDFKSKLRKSTVKTIDKAIEKINSWIEKQ